MYHITKNVIASAVMRELLEVVVTVRDGQLLCASFRRAALTSVECGNMSVMLIR